MGKSCILFKECCICKEIKPNLAFYSNGYRRQAIKPACKACMHIYKGIKKGLLPEELYVGKNYDITRLTADDFARIIKLNPLKKEFEYVTKREAFWFIKQGAAHVTSSASIECFSNDYLINRIIVMKRDRYICTYCSKPGLTADHIVSRKFGGLDTLLNLVCSCVDCNSRKGHMDLKDFLKDKMEMEIPIINIQHEIGDYVNVCLPSKKEIIGRMLGTDATLICNQNKARTIRKGCVQLLVNPLEVEDLFIANIIAQKIVPKKKESSIQTFMLSIEHSAGVYLPGQPKGIGSINGKRAIQLCEEGKAEIIKRNRIRILVEIKEMEHLLENMPKMLTEANERDELEIFPYGFVIGVYDTEGKTLGTLKAEEANHILKTGNGVQKGKSQITLTNLEVELHWLTQITKTCPKLPKWDNKLTVGVYQSNVAIGNIYGVEAKRLVSQNQATAVIGKNQIQLLICKDNLDIAWMQKNENIYYGAYKLTSNSAGLFNNQGKAVASIPTIHAALLIDTGCASVFGNNKVRLHVSVEEANQQVGLELVKISM